jgi:hypothetical protein
MRSVMGLTTGQLKQVDCKIVRLGLLTRDFLVMSDFAETTGPARVRNRSSCIRRCRLAGATHLHGRMILSLAILVVVIVPWGPAASTSLLGRMLLSLSVLVVARAPWDPAV